MNLFGLKHLSTCELYALEEIRVFAEYDLKENQGLEALFPRISTASTATRHWLDHLGSGSDQEWRDFCSKLVSRLVWEAFVPREQLSRALSPDPEELIAFFERGRAFAVDAYQRMSRMPTVNIPMKVPDLFGVHSTLVRERGPLHGQTVRTIVDMTEGGADQGGGGCGRPARSHCRRLWACRVRFPLFRRRDLQGLGRR